MSKLRTLLNPMLNPTVYLAAAGAVYAVAVMVYNVINGHAALNAPNLSALIVAAVGAVGALFTRQIVTPVKAPRDGAGRVLVPANTAMPAAPVIVPSPHAAAPPGA